MRNCKNLILIPLPLSLPLTRVFKELNESTISDLEITWCYITKNQTLLKLSKDQVVYRVPQSEINFQRQRKLELMEIVLIAQPELIKCNIPFEISRLGWKSIKTTLRPCSMAQTKQGTWYSQEGDVNLMKTALGFSLDWSLDWFLQTFVMIEKHCVFLLQWMKPSAQSIV